MSFKIKDNVNKNFTPIPGGLTRGVLRELYNIGLQKNNFNPEDVKIEPRILFVWELPDVKDSAGVPRQINAEYKLSSYATAKYRKVLESWLSKDFSSEAEVQDFDPKDLLGKTCMLNLKQSPTKTGGVWTKVDSVMALMPGMAEAPLQGKTIVYDITCDPLKDIDSLPDRPRTRILESITYEDRCKDAGINPVTFTEETDTSEEELPF